MSKFHLESRVDCSTQIDRKSYWNRKFVSISIFTRPELSSVILLNLNVNNFICNFNKHLDIMSGYSFDSCFCLCPCINFFCVFLSFILTPSAQHSTDHDQYQTLGQHKIHFNYCCIYEIIEPKFNYFGDLHTK